MRYETKAHHDVKVGVQTIGKWSSVVYICECSSYGHGIASDAEEAARIAERHIDVWKCSLEIVSR